jgi:hypothetical protein
MITLYFISAILMSAVIFLFGQYSVFVSLFIKATIIVAIVLSGFTLYCLYRKYMKGKPCVRRLTAHHRD